MWHKAGNMEQTNSKSVVSNDDTTSQCTKIILIIYIFQYTHAATECEGQFKMELMAILWKNCLNPLGTSHFLGSLRRRVMTPVPSERRGIVWGGIAPWGLS